MSLETQTHKKEKFPSNFAWNFCSFFSRELTTCDTHTHRMNECGEKRSLNGTGIYVQNTAYKRDRN